MIHRSPLRYPGGKRRLASYVADALRISALRPRLYVEPFAGGASVALHLLGDDLVESVLLGEKDPLVAAFWQTVFEDAEWLIEQVEHIEVTLERWYDYRAAVPASRRERAVACLFLNRTSFSGILSGTAGPIGGHAQRSAYGIGCRFPRAELVRRIAGAAAYAPRVRAVFEGDYAALIAEVARMGMPPEDVFFYLDPPFYQKADRLYRYYFAPADHQALHDLLAVLPGYYILSYDPAPPIVQMYEGNGIGPKRVELLYSATKDEPLPGEELIVSNLPALPDRTRLWCPRRD